MSARARERASGVHPSAVARPRPRVRATASAGGCWSAGARFLSALARAQATFNTNVGSFKLNVYRDWAPKGADRFYSLVQNDFYDGLAPPPLPRTTCARLHALRPHAHEMTQTRQQGYRKGACHSSMHTRAHARAHARTHARTLYRERTHPHHDGTRVTQAPASSAMLTTSWCNGASRALPMYGVRTIFLTLPSCTHLKKKKKKALAHHSTESILENTVPLTPT